MADEANRAGRGRVGLPPPAGRARAEASDQAPGGLAASDGPAQRLFPKRAEGDQLTPSGLTPIRVRQRANTARSEALRIDLAIFGGSFVVLLAIAALIYYVLDIYNLDSLSRTVDAQSVLFSRDPHLGAIGFVWPPLPTIARVALLPITQPLGLVPFTGQITSVAFAAGAIVVLHRILLGLGLALGARVMWLALAILNPVVLLHFTNGTAESAFTFLLLVVLLSALQLPRTTLPSISAMGLALAAALLVRYEALAIAGAAAVGVWVFMLASRHTTRGPKGDRTEAWLVALMVPIVFVGLLWLYFNWSIQGDPLFFYRSVYSVRGAVDVARNAPNHVLAYAVGSIPGTFSYLVERTLQVSALFIPAAAGLAWVAYRRRDTIALLLLLVSLSIHGMQAYQAYTGSIAPWLRYWVYLPLLTPILLAYWLPRAAWVQMVARPWRNAIIVGLVPVLMLLSNAMAFVSMQDSGVGSDEQIFAHMIVGNAEEEARVRAGIPTADTADEIVAYLNSIEGTILLDKQRSPLFIVRTEDPGRLVIDSDRDFIDMLEEAPTAVDWLLLPDPSDDTSALYVRDSVYAEYPDIYDGAPWLSLEAEFEGSPNWRIFRVVEPEDAGDAGTTAAR